MEVRPAGHEQIQPACEGQIAMCGRSVVIRVVNLDGVQAGLAERSDPLVNLRASRMSERGDSSGPMKCSDRKSVV